MDELLITIQNKNILNVFGKFDENMKIIEKSFDVSIVNRGDDIKITGAKQNIKFACAVLKALEDMANQNSTITEQSVRYLIAKVSEEDLTRVTDLIKDYICLTCNGKKIAPKTIGQKNYIENIKKETIVFGVGPAGTGKTYLAMAMAITAFKNNAISRIILTRPAIEAGEKLGFLPGDLQQKVDPYLRPLYDALHEIMGSETYLKNVEKGAIEVAPLAYMRGRTLDNSFIVLDEAQNTTPEQMKMFLTRIGYGSKMVITGDVTQIDLPSPHSSGLVKALSILDNVEGVGISHLTNKDVVRHPIVTRIINAYEKAEANHKPK